MPIRTARAVWDGTIREGAGTFSGESGTIGGKYTFNSRFVEDGTGTNPEELLAAAEASCFSMAFSGNLQRAGFPPTRIETSAACSVEKAVEGFDITRIALTVRAAVPKIDDATFQSVAQKTKETCPVSRALKGVPEISVDAKLV
jgi:lipoyl-dependent peroxiredoxin